MKRTDGRQDPSPVMVEDGRSPSTNPGSGGRPPRVLMVVAGLAAVAAVVGLATVRPGAGGEQQDPSPPTTSDLVDLVSLDGPELVWSRVDLPVEGGLTVAFADGRYLAAERIGGYENPGGLQARVWQSEDGREWQELSPAPFPNGTSLDLVTAYDGVVVTAGAIFQADSEITTGVWSWTTEAGWSQSQLPNPSKVGAGETAPYPVALVAGPLGFVLSARTGSTFDANGVVAAALPPEVAATLDAGAYLSWGTSDIEVYGPGGIAFFRASFEDLGLDRAVFSAMDRPPAVFQWWSPDGQTWVPVDARSPLQYPEVMVATEDGFVVDGWISKDGTTWTPTDDDRDEDPVQVIGRWSNRFVAFRYSTIGFLVSDDALRWSPFGPGPTSDLFSDSSWLIGGAAGDFGILVQEHGEVPRPAGLEQPPTIEKDGLVITIGGPGLRIVVQDRASGAEVLSVLSKGERTQEQVRYDFDVQTVTLNDPETGAEVVTITFAEIQAAQDAAYASVGPETHLLFTVDGKAWSHQNADTEFGGHIASMAVGDRSAVVVTGDFLGSAQLWIGTLNP